MSPAEPVRRHLHDARGELTVIRGNAALLRRDSGEISLAQRRAFAESIEQSAVQIDELAFAISASLDVAATTARIPDTEGPAVLLALFEGDPQPISVVDTDLRLILANAAARAQSARLLGREFTPGALLEDAYALHPDGWAEASGYWSSALGGQERLVTRELPVAGRPGERASFEVRYRPVRIGGQVAAAVAVGREITHRQDADAALRAAERAGAEARALAEARSRFISRMSHELRTPLNAVVGFGQLLARSTDGEAHGQAEQVLAAGHQLTRLVDDVLDLARLEAEEISVSPETVVLEETVHTLVGELDPALAARVGILPRAGEPLAVHADLQRLRQILRLLLENAERHGGGAITVALRANGLTAEIEVADEGPGIPAEEAETVFEPFGRGEGARGEGPGLGLAVARGLARAMAGEITLTRTRPGGAAFTLLLPVRWAPTAAPAPAAGPAPATAGVVLHVEDNPSNARLMRAVLGARPGVVLHTAERGSQGLELAAAHPPDLVLLDVHLPDGSGLDFIGPLREAAGRPELPIVVLTADASPGTRSRSALAGSTLHLTKPFDVDELLAVVDELILARGH